MMNCGADDLIEMAVSLLSEMLNSASNQYLHVKYVHWHFFSILNNHVGFYMQIGLYSCRTFTIILRLSAALHGYKD